VSPAAAGRSGATVALVGAGVALLVKDVFFTYSQAEFVYIGPAALCAALCGAVDWAAERRAPRAGVVAAAAALVILALSLAIYFYWFVTHYTD
jgi:drug/metabolite transporter (DMT)-like permease